MVTVREMMSVSEKRRGYSNCRLRLYLPCNALHKKGGREGLKLPPEIVPTL